MDSKDKIVQLSLGLIAASVQRRHFGFFFHVGLRNVIAIWSDRMEITRRRSSLPRRDGGGCHQEIDFKGYHQDKVEAGGSIKASAESKQVKLENKKEDGDITDPEMIYNGVDLMAIPAHPKDMGKYAIKLLPVLFSKDELLTGIVHPSLRSKRAPLDPSRVAILFAALAARYGSLKVARGRQLILDACNQKCRDVLRAGCKTPETKTNGQQE